MRNCTFASGVIAWGNLVEVGTPPQRLCLVPSTVINSTLVSQKSLCDVSNTLEPHKCEALRGGFFNENSSTTWTSAPLSSYNDTRSNPTWDHFNPPGFTKIGWDKINFPNTNVALYGAGIALNQYGNNSNAGMIGLGKDSVFLNDTISQGRAGSRSWSLDAGSKSLSNPRNGELVIGGYNAARTDGSFSWSNVSDMAGDRPCPLRTTITDMSLTLSNGNIVPIKSSAELVDACIEPYDNLFRFTAGMLLNFKQITGFNETLMNVYNNEAANNLSFTELGLPYDSSRVDTWSLSITLANGYKTSLPADELQRPLFGFDNLGNQQAVPGITNLQILDVPTGQGEVPTLGRIFLSRSYLSVNYEMNQFGLAMAAVDPQSNSYVAFPCSTAKAGTASTSSGSSFPIGPVVGGAVGGFALVVLIAVIIFLCRRRKKQNPLPYIPDEPDEPDRTEGFVVAQQANVSEIYTQSPRDTYGLKPHEPLPGIDLLSPRCGESPRSPYSDHSHATPWSPATDTSTHRIYEFPS
ncbi:acid protease [Thozetella sp. PMI_491]|nr:acid protease [Thozetella sp. PMI_491]